MLIPVISPDTEGASSAIQAMSALYGNAEKLQAMLPELEDEHLSTIFHSLEEVGSMAWKMQAAIVGELQGRATYGENAMKQIASFLNVDERRVYELGQIWNEILSQRPELGDLNLDKSHFTAALRAKSKGLDPCDILEHAVNENMGARELRRHIEGKNMGEATLIYYEMQEASVRTDAELAQKKWFSPTCRLVEVKGVQYLEIKVYK